MDPTGEEESEEYAGKPPLSIGTSEPSPPADVSSLPAIFLLFRVFWAVEVGMWENKPPKKEEEEGEEKGKPESV